MKLGLPKDWPAALVAKVEDEAIEYVRACRQPFAVPEVEMDRCLERVYLVYAETDLDCYGDLRKIVRERIRAFYKHVHAEVVL